MGAASRVSSATDAQLTRRTTLQRERFHSIALFSIFYNHVLPHKLRHCCSNLSNGPRGGVQRWPYTYTRIRSKKRALLIHVQHHTHTR